MVRHEPADVLARLAGHVAAVEVIPVGDGGHEGDDADLGPREIVAGRGAAAEAREAVCRTHRGIRSARRSHQLRHEPHAFRDLLAAEIRRRIAFGIQRRHRCTERRARGDERRAVRARRLRIHDAAPGVADVRKHEGVRPHHEIRRRAADARGQVRVGRRRILGVELRLADVLVLRRHAGLPVRERNGLRSAGRFRRRDRGAVDRVAARAAGGIDIVEPERETLVAGIALDYAAYRIVGRLSVRRDMHRERHRRGLARDERHDCGRRRVRQRSGRKREPARREGEQAFGVRVADAGIACLPHVDVDGRRSLRVGERERNLRFAERPGVRRNTVAGRTVVQHTGAGEQRPAAGAVLRIQHHVRVVIDARRARDRIDDAHQNRLGRAVDAEAVMIDRELRAGDRARVSLRHERLHLGLGQLARQDGDLVDEAVECALGEEVPVRADDERQVVLRQSAGVIVGGACHAVDVDHLPARSEGDRDVMPGVRRHREPVGPEVVDLPPPVHPARGVDVELVVRVLGHDRVEVGRQAAQLDPGGDRELAVQVEGGVVRDLDAIVDAVEIRVGAGPGVARPRWPLVIVGGAAQHGAVEATAARLQHLAAGAGPGAFLEVPPERLAR